MAGYRYYVDHLLQPTQVEENELRRIRQSFGKNFMRLMILFDNQLKFYQN